MKLSKVRDWLEIVGLFSVVLSLIFVGLQMKQSQEIAIADQYQSRLDTLVEVFATRIEDDGAVGQTGEWVRRAYLRAEETLPEAAMSQSFAEMTDEELGRMHLHNTLLFRVYDNLHFQHQRGFLDDESWESYERSARELYKIAQIKASFIVLRRDLRKSYQDFIQGLPSRAAED